jgi:RNA polymerase sigma factor for flagellar operon FliA
MAVAVSSPWQQYGRGERQPVVERLLTQFSHLVDYQVQRLLVELPASVDRDDLQSEARIGLIDAINRFDPEKNVKFETYASIRIKGALVDYLRKLDWAPRSLRQKAREIATAQSSLEQELGHSASDEQIAGKLGVGVDKYRETLGDLSVLSVMSFRDMEDDEGNEMQIAASGEQAVDELTRSGFKKAMAQSIQLLPEREKQVLELYYTRGLSLKEIGEVLSLSESRICQIHSSAVVRLRGMLEEWRGAI